MIGLYKVSIQSFRRGEPSTVLVTNIVVGKDTNKAVLLDMAKRELSVKDSGSVVWKFSSAELIKEISK